MLVAAIIGVNFDILYEFYYLLVQYGAVFA